MPMDGAKMNAQEHARDGGRHRIGPDEERLVGERAPHDRSAMVAMHDEMRMPVVATIRMKNAVTLNDDR